MKYDIYALGNALVDTEVEASALELQNLGIEKGVMTLVLWEIGIFCWATKAPWTQVLRPFSL